MTGSAVVHVAAIAVSKEVDSREKKIDTEMLIYLAFSPKGIVVFFRVCYKHLSGGTRIVEL